MKYFDFHTHAFTDQLAERALSGLSSTSGITPATDGTIGGLRRIMAQNNIGGAMLLPVATKPSQQTTINNWAAEVMGDGIFCCGSVHPDAEDAVQEIRRIKSLGLLGVKLHSEYQFFRPDEERMFPLYEEMERLGLIVVFHGGWDPYGHDGIRAVPQSFAAIAQEFPRLKIVAAHMGGMKCWDGVERYIAGKYDNIWFDTGVVARYISDEQMLRLIRLHGTERILYGSDCPWDDPAAEISLIDRLPLTDEERACIYYKNAGKLIGTKE